LQLLQKKSLHLPTFFSHFSVRRESKFLTPSNMQFDFLPHVTFPCFSVGPSVPLYEGLLLTNLPLIYLSWSLCRFRVHSLASHILRVPGRPLFLPGPFSAASTLFFTASPRLANPMALLLLLACLTFLVLFPRFAPPFAFPSRETLIRCLPQFLLLFLLRLCPSCSFHFLPFPLYFKKFFFFSLCLQGLLALIYDNSSD